jgi:hypothetical protein
MKKIDLGQTFHILANIGVIGGILLLAFELQQNNELMAAEARFNRLTMAVDAWRFRAEHGELYTLRERANNDEVLSRDEQMRVDASVMAVFVMLEWTFRELSKDSPEMNQVREVQQYNFANEASYGKVWEARKNSFDPTFVQWMEENVINR